MKKIRNSKGITLIALVITIIVLLILAGVSLNLIAGNEGILGKAASAVDKTKKASLEEEIRLAIWEKMMDYYKGAKHSSLFDFLKENLNGYKTSSGGVIGCDEEGNISNVTCTKISYI